MSIKGIIDAERWGFAKAMLMYRSGYPAVEHNDSLDRIEAAYQKEYAEWQEGDERLRRMHEEHLCEYDKRIAELEKELAEEARLNGMGAEREAKLLARVAELEKRVAELGAQLVVANEFIENRSVE